ncbi:hypothetical protein QR680_016328 [Steinernema hermaphroditum]|uniref:DUF5641 domain-containing protein n=1 Tax=Steinernema hermaphroditum TaxID=289476 RepID=A0AA39HAV9_9BILA|nr:hypothetical protein QR680_016328 [Steinernema hermaphroditum]
MDEAPILRPIDFYQRDMVLRLPNGEDNGNESVYMDSDDSPAFRSRHEAIEALKSSRMFVEKFWKIFHHEYLTSLREKHRTGIRQGRTKNVELKIGMMVLLEDENQPKRNWKLGRILHKTIGSDGKIREVTLKLGNRETVKRPVNRIIPLEIGEEKTEEGQEVENNSGEAEVDAVPSSDANLDNGQRWNHRYNLRPRNKVDYGKKW